MGLFDSLFGKRTVKEKGLKLVKKPGVKPMTDQDMENMLDDVLVKLAAHEKLSAISAISEEEFSVFIINDLEKQSIFAEKLDSNIKDCNYFIGGIKILDYSVLDFMDEDRITEIEINNGSLGLMKEVSKNTIQVHFILDIRIYFMNNEDIVFVSNIIKQPSNEETRASGIKKMQIAAAIDYYNDFITESLDTANLFMEGLEIFINQSKNEENTHRVTLIKHELNDIRSIMSSQTSMTLPMVQWFQAELLNNKQEEIIEEIIYLSDNIIKNDSWDNNFFENKETISLDLTEQQIYVIYSIYLMNDNMKKLLGMPSVYSSYVKKFKKIIDSLKGNVDAQYNLGVMYYNGEGVEQDYAKAAELYQKASDQGSAKALFNLGHMYYKGTGVEQDYAKAEKFWEKSAIQRNDRAQYSLGSMYRIGKGVKQDYTKTVNLWEKAVNQGNVDAQYNLGVMYYDGEGVEQDYAKAAELYQKASDQGSANALYNLGVMYYKGIGVRRNHRKTSRLYQKAADGGSISAQYFLGFMYYDGEGVEQDYAKAKELFRKSCEGGHNEGCKEYTKLNTK